MCKKLVSLLFILLQLKMLFVEIKRNSSACLDFSMFFPLCYYFLQLLLWRVFFSSHAILCLLCISRHISDTQMNTNYRNVVCLFLEFRISPTVYFKTQISVILRPTPSREGNLVFVKKISKNDFVYKITQNSMKRV